MVRQELLGILQGVHNGGVHMSPQMEHERVEDLAATWAKVATEQRLENEIAVPHSTFC